MGLGLHSLGRELHRSWVRELHRPALALVEEGHLLDQRSWRQTHRRLSAVSIPCVHGCAEDVPPAYLSLFLRSAMSRGRGY